MKGEPLTVADVRRPDATAAVGELDSHTSDPLLVRGAEDARELESEAASSMSRLERLAQRSGVELAAQEIERLLVRSPEANAAEALSMVRGLAQVLSFSL